MASKPTPTQAATVATLKAGDADTRVLSTEEHMDGNVVMICRHVRYRHDNYWSTPYTQMYRIHPDGSKQSV